MTNVREQAGEPQIDLSRPVTVDPQRYVRSRWTEVFVDQTPRVVADWFGALQDLQARLLREFEKVIRRRGVIELGAR
jgi:hypothetical protein